MMKAQQGLKNSKKDWVAVRLNWLGSILRSGVLSVLFFLIFLTPVQAEQGHQRLVYEVYAGGIHAVQASLDIDLSKRDRYSLTLEAKTRGLLGRIAPWSGIFESHGWVDGKSYQPELHQSTTTWKDEPEVKSYNYARDGSFVDLVITENDKAPQKREPDAALTKDTMDALTATLLVMQNVDKTGECDGSSDVFDGKRRYALVFKHQDKPRLEPSKYNIYGGEAARCTAEVKPIAGAWHKKPRGWMSIQEQGRERGMFPTIWMGKLNGIGPAVPVKVFVKTAYGALFMHLAEYESADEILIAEKREK